MFPFRHLLAPLVVTALSACATDLTGVASIAPAEPAHALFAGAESCRVGQALAPSRGTTRLDPAAIEVVTWNMQKGRHPGWAAELQAHGAAADLVMLQEAPLANAGWARAATERFHAFAPGYETRLTQTGVMNVSRATPLVQCSLASPEPLLRTPKATIVTEYAIAGRDETLLVVNVHAINFALTVDAFERQMGLIEEVIAQHDGAVVLAGDFNTWHRQRLELLSALAARSGLAPVRFERDGRKRVFGLPLDHVFVRGLNVDAAGTVDTAASDHNPMLVKLSL